MTMTHMDIKTPCAECPFIQGTATNRTLMPGRLDQIKRDLCSGEATSFTCHKTIGKPVEQHCAGALVYLEKLDRPTQLMRVAERFGMYDRTKLDMNVNIDM